MSILIDCPSCTRKLRVPAELLGSEVRCPTCGSTFDASAASLAACGPRAETADAEGSEAYQPHPAAGADQEPCPFCGERIARQALRCRFCGEELYEDEEDDDRPWERPFHGGMRRDAEPHRGPLILTLGILSIVLAASSIMMWGLCNIVGLPLGITAWVLGQADMKKMQLQAMDPRGMGLTQAGWICGIIGTVLSLMCGLGVLAVIGFLIVGIR